MINGCLFQTINSSLLFLAEFLEKYNAVLPFSKISEKLASLLPVQIYAKRVFFRKKYFLPEDNFGVFNDNSSTFYENEKKYEEILLSVLQELYEGFTSSNSIQLIILKIQYFIQFSLDYFLATAHLKIEHMTIPPFLYLELKLSDSSMHRKTNKDSREELRKDNRAFLKKKISNLKQKTQKPKFTTNLFENKEKIGVNSSLKLRKNT